MTKPNGGRVTAAAIPAADGWAIFTSYRFNKKQDRTGNYQVSVSTNLNGISGSERRGEFFSQAIRPKRESEIKIAFPFASLENFRGFCINL